MTPTLLQPGIYHDGIRLPASDEPAVDVLFDGRRIWSIPGTSRGRWSGMVPWPPALQPYLDGQVEVQVRSHATGELLLSGELSFGSSTERVQVVDTSGRPLALTKWGKLNHPFDASDRSAIEGYLDQVEEVLEFLDRECAVPAFLTYGSLLGAVREGGLIGHDVDVDLGYLSRHSHPADVMLESFEIERRARARGWKVRRENGGFLALFLPQSDGTMRNLDIFTAYVVEDHLYEVHDTRVQGGRAIVEPLAPVSFEGRELPGPAQPEVMLEAAYGTGWRVPDPAFSFHTPKPTRRRIMGWMGGVRDERDGWNDFYRPHASDAPAEPSPFAHWARDRVSGQELGQVVDLGCGPGRDSVFFAEQGYAVVAADFSAPVLREARAYAHQAQVEVTFLEWNLNSLRESLARAAVLAARPGQHLVYARLLLNALPDHARRNFWTATQMLLAGGGRCLVEFRTKGDRWPGRSGAPAGRPMDPGQIVEEAAVHRLQVVERWQGAGGRGPGGDGGHELTVCRLELQARR
jgi:SAM-dependent methyltransferase